MFKHGRPLSRDLVRFTPYDDSDDVYRGTTVLPYLENYYQYGSSEDAPAPIIDRGIIHRLLIKPSVCVCVINSLACPLFIHLKLKCTASYGLPVVFNQFNAFCCFCCEYCVYVCVWLENKTTNIFS